MSDKEQPQTNDPRRLSPAQQLMRSVEEAVQRGSTMPQAVGPPTQKRPDSTIRTKALPSTGLPQRFSASESSFGGFPTADPSNVVIPQEKPPECSDQLAPKPEKERP